jgi:hypothetical protein
MLAVNFELYHNSVECIKCKCLSYKVALSVLVNSEARGSVKLFILQCSAEWNRKNLVLKNKFTKLRTVLPTFTFEGLLM